MHSELVVVAAEGRKDAAQVGLAKNDDVIEAFPADRTDQPLRVPVLPRASPSRWVITDAHGGKTLRDCLAVTPVAVPDHELGRFIPGERIRELAGDPVYCRMVGEARSTDVSA